MEDYYISPEEMEHYKREGYVFLHNVMKPEELEELRDRVDGLLEGRYDSTGFKAGVGSKNAENDPGKHIKQVSKLIKPILDPVFRKYSEHPVLLSIVRQLMEAHDCEVFQMQALVKEPGLPNATPWHQDEFYWKKGGQRVTAWFPLEPLTPDNGTMSLFPGSHLGQVYYHDRAEGVSDFFTFKEKLDESKALPIIIPLGSVSFHHQRMIHGAFPNIGKTRRIAVAQHYLEIKQEV